MNHIYFLSFYGTIYLRTDFRREEDDHCGDEQIQRALGVNAGNKRGHVLAV